MLSVPEGRSFPKNIAKATADIFMQKADCLVRQKPAQQQQQQQQTLCGLFPALVGSAGYIHVWGNKSNNYFIAKLSGK